MSKEITIVEQSINALEPKFNEMVTEDLVTFKKEASFAIQSMQKNDFLLGVAQRNPESMKNAVLNIASIGLSLNPASALAYLVPRDQMVCLDVSYRGFVELAVSSGAITWMQAKIVCEKDEFLYTGVNTKPVHTYDAFGDRGKMTGVYCVAKTNEGDFLTETMSKAEVDEIKNTSKAKNGPWKNFYNEMAKKSVVKRACKLLPQSSRLNEAINIVNQHEGIDKEREQEEAIEAAEARREANKKKAGEFEAKAVALEEIKVLCTAIMNGHSQQEKAEFMTKVLKVGSWDILKKKNLETIQELTVELKAKIWECPTCGLSNQKETTTCLECGQQRMGL